VLSGAGRFAGVPGSSGAALSSCATRAPEAGRAAGSLASRRRQRSASAGGVSVGSGMGLVAAWAYSIAIGSVARKGRWPASIW
jgi:hypothetical protein